LFVFHSKTRRRKKHRVAAGADAADLGSEVPNLGVARALFVILLLHVAAIAAIFVHNRVTNDDPVVTSSDPSAAAAALSAQTPEKLPVVRKGEDFYFVATGDTYERIARLKGVDINALRDLNDNVRLKAGRILRIPAAGASAQARPATPVATVEPAEVQSTVPSAPPEAPSAVPVASPAPAPAAVDTRSPGTVVVKRAVPAKALHVMVEKPNQPRSTPATKVTPKAVPVENSPPATATGNRYKVRAGDTAWRIAQRHKVSVKSLLKANGIADARKMRSGMTLKIPAK